MAVGVAGGKGGQGDSFVGVMELFEGLSTGGQKGGRRKKEVGGGEGTQPKTWKGIRRQPGNTEGKRGERAVLGRGGEFVGVGIKAGSFKEGSVRRRKMGNSHSLEIFSKDAP